MMAQSQQGRMFVARRPTAPSHVARPGADGTLDRRWHLARTEAEVPLTELEYALMRAQEAFSRWQAECFAAVSGMALSGGENAMLHVIRLNDRPKSLKEIARLTNRDDVPNLQYALRKLVKLGLVKLGGSGRANSVYVVTDAGMQLTDAYAALRANLLGDYAQAVPGLDERMRQATQTLDLLSGIYEQAARVAATHRPAHED